SHHRTFAGFVHAHGITLPAGGVPTVAARGAEPSAENTIQWPSPRGLGVASPFLQLLHSPVNRLDNKRPPMSPVGRGRECAKLCIPSKNSALPPPLRA